MGTDVEMWCEVKRDAWEQVSPPEEIAEIMECRNYTLFAVIAGVRADDRAEDCFPPISELKGIPVDASPAVREELGNDAENEPVGWLSLRELNEFDWSQTRQGRGYVVPELVKYFEGNPLGFPDEVYSVSDSSRLGVEVRWRETAEQMAGGFYRKVIPWLRTLGDLDCVRIVFRFC